MAQQKQKVNPKYQKIYADLIAYRFPKRKDEFRYFLEKETPLTALEIIILNEKLFGSKIQTENQRLRSYDKNDIRNILQFQKDYNLNNSTAAKRYNISRNTIARWKKIFS